MACAAHLLWSLTVVLVTNQDPSLLKPASDLAPPELRGYLNKYTNVAKGYNTRWFVLKDGVLSCASYHLCSICVLTARKTIDIRRMSQSQAEAPLQ